MIPFRRIRIDDRGRIERYTMPSPAVNCDLAFANMFCWQELYQSAWAEIDGRLVIRFLIDGGTHIGYMQPLGEGDFTPILPALAADARALGHRLRLIGLTDEACALMRRTLPDAFAFASAPATDDYVYAADDLRQLPGRRYQPKRNHINRFAAAHPDYRYEPLTADRFDECLALERAWSRTHADDDRAAERLAEQRAMQRAFDHFDALGLTGGCILSGDRLVAFTYGSAVNDHTFDIHVEKADPDFARDGAFAVINKRFAEQLPARFTLIDREEDLGIEGLRQAKRSYHPLFLQRKFTALRLDDDERACRALWREAFGDDDAFIDSFLMRYYAPERMLTRRCDGRLAAMLHLVPFDSELGRTTYIYGVATDPALRDRGLASQLMAEALRRIDARGDTALLIPSPGDERLRSFYGRFGFTGSIPTAFRTPDGFDFGTGDPATDRAMVRHHDAAAPLPAPLPEALTCRYRTA